MRRRWKVLLSGLIVAGILVASAVNWQSPRERRITELQGPVLRLHVDNVYSAPGIWILLPKPAEEISEPAAPLADSLSPSARSLRNEGYLGAKACAECHQDKYSTFTQTAHYRTSQAPTRDSIRGSFEPGRNLLETSRKNLRFQMDARSDGFFQGALVEDQGVTYRHNERFDIVTGSGNHGQSFLYWKGDRLYQLPVSYFAQSNEWVNSPGFTEGTANFSRAIRSRCLECHTTYFEHVPETLNRYHPENFILGISCERCHGPGFEHVSYHRSHPSERHAHGIVNPAYLPVERRHDVCRQCHSPAAKSLKEAFTFRPGKTLSEYLDLHLDTQEAPSQTGIHTANQFARLRMSRCFQKSPEMSCIDCHNPHRNERENLALFSERCQKCHQPRDCGMSVTLGDKISKNCINCHMPMKFDALVVVKTATSETKNQMRDHFIGIDLEASDRVLEKLRSMDKREAPDLIHKHR